MSVILTDADPRPSRNALQVPPAIVRATLQQLATTFERQRRFMPVVVDAYGAWFWPEGSRGGDTVAVRLPRRYGGM